jgi:hypothetical protein
LVHNRHHRPQAGDGDTRGVSADVDDVVAVGAVDDHAVGRSVAYCPAEGGGEIDVQARHVGPRQVVDGDQVGRAEGVEVDPLDTRRVHGDVGLGAEEPEPVPVC